MVGGIGQWTIFWVLCLIARNLGPSSLSVEVFTEGVQLMLAFLYNEEILY